MSFTSRLSSSPASVQRDYGFLTAPSTSYRPFAGLEDDVSEASEDEELDDGDEEEQDQDPNEETDRERTATTRRQRDASQHSIVSTAESSDSLSLALSQDHEQGQGQQADDTAKRQPVPVGQGNGSSTEQRKQQQQQSAARTAPATNTSARSQPPASAGFTSPFAFEQGAPGRRGRRRSSVRDDAHHRYYHHHQQHPHNAHSHAESQGGSGQHAAGTRSLAEQARDLLLGGAPALRPPVEVWEDRIRQERRRRSIAGGDTTHPQQQLQQRTPLSPRLGAHGSSSATFSPNQNQSSQEAAGVGSSSSVFSTSSAASSALTFTPHGLQAASAAGAPSGISQHAQASAAAAAAAAANQRWKLGLGLGAEPPLPVPEDVLKVQHELGSAAALAAAAAQSESESELEEEEDVEAAAAAGGSAVHSAYGRIAGAPHLSVSHERTPLLASHPIGTPAAPGGGSGYQSLPVPSPLSPADLTVQQDVLPPLKPLPGAGRREIRTLVSYSLPIWGTHLLELSLNVVTVFSLGHLGTDELGAASLASMTANVTGFSVLAGFVSALDSLLPAAYSSAHPWTVGVWTQRMGLILVVLLLPITAIWWSAESILLALGQDPIIAELAARYLFVLSFALPAYAGFETLRRYLQAQGLFSAPTVAVGLASIINVPLNILLVYGPDSVRLGFIGAPIASLISYYLMFFLGVLQCLLAPKDAWGGWSKRAFDLAGLKVCFTLGFASTTAMAAEWWAWEIAGLMTSFLGKVALAAQSILLVSSSITYQLPNGIAVAVAVRVGNLLGANQPSLAALSARMSLLVALAAGGLNSGMFIAFRNHWGKAFSSDAHVIGLVASLLPLLGAFQIADSICGVGGGILRGSGRQHLGAYINFVAYYIVGLPFAVLLVRLGVGLAGIWWGLTVGLYLGAVGIYAVLLRTDWNVEARKVLARMEADAATQVPIAAPVVVEVPASEPIA